MLKVRLARSGDVPDLTTLLNQIVMAGGTTAREKEMSAEAFHNHYLAGPGYVSCVVAEEADGTLYGFQALERIGQLAPDWADIGTFARLSPKRPGVGRAMFPVTRCHARDAGLVTINAMIRSDNVPGLSYYSAMGFVDYDLVPGVPLADGTPVDRLLKRYDLT